MSILSDVRRFISGKMGSPKPSRTFVTKCRGIRIERPDIFKYTNGRFLTGEKSHLDSRYVNFDLDKLCEVAASVGPSVSPVKAVDKFEGGYSKALILEKEDGTELVAKIPFPIAGPPKYTTASEVAILEYVGTHTEVPSPKVYAWNSDATNPVGAEYIIMEKARGVQLFRVWEHMSEVDRLGLIKTLVQCESQLMELPFPGCGSLYLRSSLSESDETIILPTSIDPTQEYCLGRSCEPGWQTIDDNLVPGPWPSAAAFGIYIAQREISRSSREINFKLPHAVRGDQEDQMSLLQFTLQIMEIMSCHSLPAKQSRPMLCHTDLHMGNIFVDEDNPSTVTSIIDWQSQGLAPMFLQARWPVFLKPPVDYPTGLVKPKLPEEFSRLPAEEQELAKHNFMQAKAAKAYEVRCLMENREVHEALNQSAVWRDLFMHCAETWDEGPAPLRECLITISTSWQELGFPGRCPFHADEKLLQKHKEQLDEYVEWSRVQKAAKECLDTDADGWISPEADFDERVIQNESLFRVFSKSMADRKSSGEIREWWPFRDSLGRYS